MSKKAKAIICISAAYLAFFASVTLTHFGFFSLAVCVGALPFSAGAAFMIWSDL